MADREKVINGLIDFVADLSPFAGNHADWVKVNNAVKYLKEQEPIAPKKQEETCIWTVCGNCSRHLISMWAYCPYCGRKVKWDE